MRAAVPSLPARLALLAALAVPAFALTAHAPPAHAAGEAEMVLGPWTCDISDPADPSTAGSIANVEYFRDGTWSGYLSSNYADQGTPFAIEMLVAGDWSIDNGRIIEAISTYTMLGLDVSGQKVGWAEVDPSMRAAVEQGFDGMIGVKVGSTFLDLTETSMVVKDQMLGEVTVCKRPR